jgi:hypothetical protein
VRQLSLGRAARVPPPTPHERGRAGVGRLYPLHFGGFPRPALLPRQAATRRRWLRVSAAPGADRPASLTLNRRLAA